MTRQQSLLFLILAAVFTLTRFIDPYPLSWLVKILPLLLLMGVTVKLAKNKHEKLFLMGLVFSALGDFFLDYDRLNWFILGLGAFLFAHIFYLLSFRPIYYNQLKHRLLYLVSYCVYGIAMFTIISTSLGELFIPVLIYMTILLLMALTTLVSEKSNPWLIVGGLSFVISDSILGVDKFYYQIENAHFYIMISYYFAQYALVKGMFYQPKPTTE